MFMKYKKTPPEKSGGAFSKGVWNIFKIKDQKVSIYSIKFLSLDMYVGSFPPLLWCRTFLLNIV